VCLCFIFIDFIFFNQVICILLLSLSFALAVQCGERCAYIVGKTHDSINMTLSYIPNC
jgi:hypothetical protein